MDKKKIRGATKGFTFGMLLMIAGVWALGALWSLYFWHKGKIGEAAQFGDSFGGLNALLTGLGLVAIALSLFKQHVDSMEAEERRQEDKSESEAARLETTKRHNQGLEAQERIARIQGTSALLNYALQREKSVLHQRNLVRKLVAFDRALFEGVNMASEFLPTIAKAEGGREFIETLLECTGKIGGRTCLEVSDSIKKLASEQLPALRELANSNNASLKVVLEELGDLVVTLKGEEEKRMAVDSAPVPGAE
jgi:hypothetical protein